MSKSLKNFITIDVNYHHHLSTIIIDAGLTGNSSKIYRSSTETCLPNATMECEGRLFGIIDDGRSSQH